MIQGGKSDDIKHLEHVLSQCEFCLISGIHVEEFSSRKLMILITKILSDVI